MKKEDARLGLRYGVITKWTSFLAVQREEDVDVEQEQKDVAGFSQNRDICPAV